jgi:hypothetical protein
MPSETVSSPFVGRRTRMPGLPAVRNCVFQYEYAEFTAAVAMALFVIWHMPVALLCGNGCGMPGMVRPPPEPPVLVLPAEPPVGAAPPVGAEPPVGAAPEPPLPPLSSSSPGSGAFALHANKQLLRATAQIP